MPLPLSSFMSWVFVEWAEFKPLSCRVESNNYRNSATASFKMKAFHFSFPKCAGGHKLCCLFYLSLPVHALACKMHLRERSEGWPHDFVSFILKHSLLFWEALYPSNIRFSGWLGVWTWLVHRPGILNKEEFAWESQPLGESCSKSVIEYTSAMVKSWIIYIHDMYVYIYICTHIIGGMAIPSWFSESHVFFDHDQKIRAFASTLQGFASTGTGRWMMSGSRFQEIPSDMTRKADSCASQVAIRQCTGQLKYCYEYQAVVKQKEWITMHNKYIEYTVMSPLSCHCLAQSLSIGWSTPFVRDWMVDLSSPPWQIAAPGTWFQPCGSTGDGSSYLNYLWNSCKINIHPIIPAMSTRSWRSPRRWPSTWAVPQRVRQEPARRRRWRTRGFTVKHIVSCHQICAVFNGHGISWTWPTWHFTSIPSDEWLSFQA